MNTNTDADSQPVAGQVERPVRPRAWEVRQGSRAFYLSNAEFVRSSYDAGSFTPLYDQAALDAAVAAERERWIRLVCERLDATVMSGYASTKECEAARAALRGVLVYENAA